MDISLLMFVYMYIIIYVHVYTNINNEIMCMKCIFDKMDTGILIYLYIALCTMKNH